MNRKTNLIDSFGLAFEGLKFSILRNRNMRIHIVVAFLVIFFSYFFKINVFEAGLVLIMIVLVIVVEMINTVVEETVNLIARDYKMEAKIAKDVSAGAVLFVSFASVVVGIFVFGPYILSALKK